MQENGREREACLGRTSGWPVAASHSLCVCVYVFVCVCCLLAFKLISYDIVEDQS